MYKTALLLGATGLVGSECLKELLASPCYQQVKVLTRRPLEVVHPKLQTIVADMEQPDLCRAQLAADDVYCALGTTIAKAGSQQAFRKVDYELPLQVAEIVHTLGAKKFILVSSLGADVRSRIFYSRVKGELEKALTKLKFSSLVIFRPSILLGHRREKRFGEAIGRFFVERFSFLFAGPLKKYRGVPAVLLAKAMIYLAQQNTPQVYIVANEEMFEQALT